HRIGPATRALRGGYFCMPIGGQVCVPIDTIGAERDIRSLTHEERKAWSLNMGHDSELTTERHYGIMPDDKRFEVLEGIGSKRTIDPRNLSESEKAKILDSIFEALSDRR
ncbi:hypothetical protein PVW51_23825, partial [Sulfitobacter sp. PR48]|nr:hypothetical protein [Sulfitobacter sp. PR48]